MTEQQLYDVAIIGGGLAGLAAAIELKRCGHSVVLFEKENYPYHKVCGEYISRESWNYITSLGLPLGEMSLPLINNVLITAPSGKEFKTKLPLGGFGISRHLLDASLAAIAKTSGVDLYEATKVNDVHFNEFFTVSYASLKGNEQVRSRLCLAAYGKRSNLDVKWKRKFLSMQDKRLENYMAVKYHIEANWPGDLIALHNFKNGYCGISKIEGNKYCLCYLVKARELQLARNDLDELEQNCLAGNPHLKKIFSERKVLPGFPVTISQVNFHSRTQVEDHILMLGDAAGMITPLCGNGMSIALHTAKIAAVLSDRFLQGSITREQLETEYALQWKINFGKRLQTGRLLQKFFGSKLLSNVFIGLMKIFPFFARPLIKMTHGRPF
jgi:menaquinone-9 beta-reductase